VVRSGTTYERGGNSTIIAPSVEGMVVLRVSLGLKPWSYLVERGFDVAVVGESVLGGEDRSILGPASDIRETESCWHGARMEERYLRRLDQHHDMTERRTRLN